MWIEIALEQLQLQNQAVTPYAGVWIEIGSAPNGSTGVLVTPYAGVWIEMYVF